MVDKQRIAHEYDRFWADVWDSSDDWTKVGKKSLRMFALQNLPSNPGRVLDLGCGNGLAMSLLRQRNQKVIGCDISLGALRAARLQGEVARADGTRLPFRSSSFRYVLLLDALEHVVEKRSLVRECWRVLANDGMVALTTPLPSATNGLGDRRQPYDRPATYSEIVSMTSGLFRICRAKGVFELRGVGTVWRVLPSRLFTELPVLLEKASEIMLIFSKITNSQQHNQLSEVSHSAERSPTPTA